MTFAGVNYLAVLIAAVGGWVTGAIWYGLFGKSWLAALGKTKADMKRRKKTPAFYAPFAIAFAAVLIMARGAGGTARPSRPGTGHLAKWRDLGGLLLARFCRHHDHGELRFRHAQGHADRDRFRSLARRAHCHGGNNRSHGGALKPDVRNAPPHTPLGLPPKVQQTTPCPARGGFA
jgi:hypothetical protein